MSQTVPQAAESPQGLSGGDSRGQDLAADSAGQASGIGSFDELYNRYKPVLTQYAIRQNATDPDGVADLALFDGYRALDRMRRCNEHTVRSYLYQAVRSHATEEGRKTIPMPTTTDDANVSPFLGFESELIDTMTVHAMLDELPADQRAVVEHRFIYGRSAKETGWILGKKPNAVYQLQHRATRRLHRMILAGGVALLIGVAVIVAERTQQQTVDSTPATSTDTPEENSFRPDTTGDIARTSGVDGSDEAESVVADTSVIEQFVRDEQGQEVDTSVTVAAEEAGDGQANVVTPRSVPSSPTTVRPSAEAQQPPEEPEPDVATDTDPVTPPGDESPEEDLPPTTQAPAPVQLIAGNDTVQVTQGTPVSFSVVENDAPAGFIDQVSVVSGHVPGLTLSPQGDLTGAPTAAELGTYIIVYRITGVDGASALGQIEVILS